MPITNRTEAKETGFAQIREAMTRFKGRVTDAEFGQWGGTLVDDEGKPLPPKEFLEVKSIEVEVLEATEELSKIPEEWSFRINCSEFKGSFWIEKFLESADRAKVLIPDGLKDKVITWRKETLVAKNPKYNSTNWIIEKIEGTVKQPVVVKTVPTPSQPKAGVSPNESDPMEGALRLAIGKTEAQFRTAISLDQSFINNPIIPMAKAGIVTQALLRDGKLVLVKEGTKEVYRTPS